MKDVKDKGSTLYSRSALQMADPDSKHAKMTRIRTYTASNPYQDRLFQRIDNTTRISRDRASSKSSNSQRRELFPQLTTQYSNQTLLRESGLRPSLSMGSLQQNLGKSKIKAASAEPELEEGEIREAPVCARPQRVEELSVATTRPRADSGTKRCAETDQRQTETKRSRLTGVTDVPQAQRDPFVVDKRLALTRDNCFPGTIFTAVILEPIVDDKLLHNHLNVEADSRIIDAGADGYFIRKDRPWIVTSVHQDGYQAVPVHSHNGHGLDGMRHNAYLASEFIRIEAPRDWEGKGGSTYIRKERQPLTVEVIYDDFPWLLYSYAWVTYPVSRRFKGNATVIGKLEHDSTHTLINLLRAYAAYTYKIPVNTWEPPPRHPEAEPAPPEIEDVSMQMSERH